MVWLVLLAVVVTLGALARGKSFGESVRLGCGCLATIVVGLLILIMITEV
jgi:hypothetical protein